jgi:hypothetical protein
VEGDFWPCYLPHAKVAKDGKGNRDSGVKGLGARGRGIPHAREIREAEFGIRNSEIGKRKRAEGTTGGREVGLILNVEFWIGEGIAHAKGAKDAKGGRKPRPSRGR